MADTNHQRLAEDARELADIDPEEAAELADRLGEMEPNLVVPERSAETLFPSDEQLADLSLGAFLDAVDDALAAPVEELNQGGRSARTKFIKRVRPRYLHAQEILKAQQSHGDLDAEPQRETTAAAASLDA